VSRMSPCGTTKTPARRQRCKDTQISRAELSN
jgi:hypothetical protein